MEAVVSFHFRANGDLDALAINIVGDNVMLKHLVPAYFDKILSNTAIMRKAGRDLLSRAEEVWTRASLDLTEENVYVSAVPVFGGTQVPPDATVSIRMSGALDSRRIGAVTHFKPSNAANPTVAEFALWAIWDWTVANIGDWSDVQILVGRMLWQCGHYGGRQPRMRDLGRAPFLSAAEFDLLPSYE